MPTVESVLSVLVEPVLNNDYPIRNRERHCVCPAEESDPVPRSAGRIISDRDTRFTSEVWQHMCKKLYI